jgi:hypothetical protein
MSDKKSELLRKKQMLEEFKKRKLERILQKVKNQFESVSDLPNQFKNKAIIIILIFVLYLKKMNSMMFKQHKQINGTTSLPESTLKLTPSSGSLNEFENLNAEQILHKIGLGDACRPLSSFNSSIVVSNSLSALSSVSSQATISLRRSNPSSNQLSQTQYELISKK